MIAPVRARVRPPRSLRGRLVALSVLSILLAIAVLGVSAAIIVRVRLHDSLDAALSRRATDVARLSVSAPALITAEGQLDAPEGTRQVEVEVVDRRGRLVARSQTLGGLLLPGGVLLRDALRDGRGGFADATLGSTPIRLYVAPLAESAGPASGGAVLVASSTSDIAATLHRLGLSIAISAILAAALGALAAAALTRRGLRPLARLSSAARRIERTVDPSERLPVPATGDELSELAGTLNSMLGALERARDTERRFLADASHELRTPLTALRGNASYIARHGADPGVLADIERDARRLGHLIDDLLALEREQSGPAAVEPVALDEIARAAAAREPRARVEHCEPVQVLGERDTLERALENLIANARTHGPPGGVIRISVAKHDGRARLAVEDDGPGLEGERAEQAFARFWRGPESAGRPGSGLGLAIVAATARRLGGSVDVERSRFTIDLPVAHR